MIMQFFVNSVPVCGDTVPLGVQGENLATQITADVSGWLAQWPDGQVIVRLIDANRQSHLADTVVSDGTLVWIVTAADTALGGYGVGVIELVQGDVVKKSEPFATRVITDPQASGQAPEPVPGWVEETIARMEELEAGAAQSAGDAQTSAESAQTSAQSAQTAAAQAAQSAEDAAAVLPQVETAGAAQVTAIQAAGQQQTQAVTAAGAQQVSAVQTEGADQRASIETAGAAQVNAIQAEGQTQQTAIQQKGADTLASIPADYTELSGDVADLKSQSPSVKVSDATEADLDLTDSDGNVIARFANGHIQTKEFDSANIPASGGSVDAKISSSTADLVLSDAQGNVVAEFTGGHIRAKNFNSADVADELNVVHDISGDDYIKTFAYDTTVSTKQTITGDFREGDTILCHFSNADDDITDFSNTVLLTYGYVDTTGAEHTLGQAYPYDFARFTLPEDATAIYGNFGTGLLYAGTYTCKFLVYKLSQYTRQPHVITVGSDGRRMFTSIRAAMDSFSDNNAYNTYEIWVYPGTYNILSDYTADEINADGFVGLWVKNGVSIIGQGHREDIIIHGELSPDDYNATKRNAISTLNMSGNCGLKNITVTNRYLRYAVHDDHGSGFRQEQTRIVENCKFQSVDAASGGIGQAAYGAGGHNNKKMIVRNCDLGDRFIIHNTKYMIYAPMTAVVENCTAQMVTLTDNNNTDNPWTMPTRIEFNNCNFDYVRHDRTEDGSAPTMTLAGVGTHNVKLDCEAGTLYNFGDCMTFPAAIGAGQAVKMSGIRTVTATASKEDMYGISIGNDGIHTYVQRQGYIAAQVLGLTNLSVGDYVTLDASGIVTTTGATASNAVGIVETIADNTGTAFIKMIV